MYTWYKHVYTFTRLYIHVYDMYIQSRKCIDMFMAGLSPSMRQTLHKHVYALYIHVYVIWSGFQIRRLARGRVSEKQPSEVRKGPPLGAKASRSKIQKCHDGPSLKRQIFKIQARLINAR